MASNFLFGQPVARPAGNAPLTFGQSPSPLSAGASGFASGQTATGAGAGAQRPSIVFGGGAAAAKPKSHIVFGAGNGGSGTVGQKRPAAPPSQHDVAFGNGQHAALGGRLGSHMQQRLQPGDNTDDVDMEEDSAYYENPAAKRKSPAPGGRHSPGPGSSLSPFPSSGSRSPVPEVNGDAGTPPPEELQRRQNRAARFAAANAMPAPDAAPAAMRAPTPIRLSSALGPAQGAPVFIGGRNRAAVVASSPAAAAEAKRVAIPTHAHGAFRSGRVSAGGTSSPLPLGGDDLGEMDLSKFGFLIKGTCEDMCPEEERIRRATNGELALFERVDPEDRRKTHKDICVTRNMRNYDHAEKSADAINKLFRTPAALGKAMDFLRSLMDRNDSLDKIHAFLWDRYRCIRKEIETQRLPQVTELLGTIIAWNEEILRWHLLAQYELQEYGVPVLGETAGTDAMAFDDKLNAEQLVKVFQDLMKYYTMAEEMQVAAPNSAEFKCYFVLITHFGGIQMKKRSEHGMNKIAASFIMRQMTQQEKTSNWFNVMLMLMRVLDHGDTVTFFRVVEAAPYHLAVVLSYFFPHMRRFAQEKLARHGYQRESAENQHEIALDVLMNGAEGHLFSDEVDMDEKPVHKAMEAISKKAAWPRSRASSESQPLPQELLHMTLNGYVGSGAVQRRTVQRRTDIAAAADTPAGRLSAASASATTAWQPRPAPGATTATVQQQTAPIRFGQPATAQGANQAPEGMAARSIKQRLGPINLTPSTAAAGASTCNMPLHQTDGKRQAVPWGAAASHQALHQQQWPTPGEAAAAKASMASGRVQSAPSPFLQAQQAQAQDSADATAQAVRGGAPLQFAAPPAPVWEASVAAAFQPQGPLAYPASSGSGGTGPVQYHQPASLSQRLGSMSERSALHAQLVAQHRQGQRQQEALQAAQQQLSWEAERRRAVEEEKAHYIAVMQYKDAQLAQMGQQIQAAIQFEAQRRADETLVEQESRIRRFSESARQRLALARWRTALAQLRAREARRQGSLTRTRIGRTMAPQPLLASAGSPGGASGGSRSDTCNLPGLAPKDDCDSEAGAALAVGQQQMGNKRRSGRWAQAPQAFGPALGPEKLPIVEAVAQGLASMLLQRWPAQQTLPAAGTAPAAPAANRQPASVFWKLVINTGTDERGHAEPAEGAAQSTWAPDAGSLSQGVAAVHHKAAEWLRGTLSCGRTSAYHPPSGRLLAQLPAPLPAAVVATQPHRDRWPRSATVCIEELSATRLQHEAAPGQQHTCTSLAAVSAVLLLVSAVVLEDDGGSPTATAEAEAELAAAWRRLRAMLERCCGSARLPVAVLTLAGPGARDAVVASFRAAMQAWPEGVQGRVASLTVVPLAPAPPGAVLEALYAVAERAELPPQLVCLDLDAWVKTTVTDTLQDTSLPTVADIVTTLIARLASISKAVAVTAQSHTAMHGHPPPELATRPATAAPLCWRPAAVTLLVDAVAQLQHGIATTSATFPQAEAPQEAGSLLTTVRRREAVQQLHDCYAHWQSHRDLTLSANSNSGLCYVLRELLTQRRACQAGMPTATRMWEQRCVGRDTGAHQAIRMDDEDRHRATMLKGKELQMLLQELQKLMAGAVA